jgi:predicted polyphosphate/ATP-dependent NAD kinase
MDEMASKPLIGFIINPIAGMGGSVGLKGTDGQEILEEARSRGAQPHAQQRAAEFFHSLSAVKGKIKILTIPGVMGGDVAVAHGFDVELIHNHDLPASTELYRTDSSLTIRAAQFMQARSVALIVFLGGDGTARDMVTAIGQSIPSLGIPGGVKIHSSVFAINPDFAAQLVLAFLWGEIGLRESEVMDIDEEAFRENRVVSKLYGYLLTPYAPTYSQPSKMGSPQTEDEHVNQDEIARWLIEEMTGWEKDRDWYYLVGPGTTCRAVNQQLNLPKNLLGVDLIHNKQLIAEDLNETQIMNAISGKHVKLIVTPIGAQGFIFGRGNLQLSPKVLRAIGLENILIIATKYKLSTLPDGKLRIDSRDPEFDAEFRGLYRVLIGYGQYRIVDVV